MAPRPTLKITTLDVRCQRDTLYYRISAAIVTVVIHMVSTEVKMIGGCRQEAHSAAVRIRLNCAGSGRVGGTRGYEKLRRRQVEAPRRTLLRHSRSKPLRFDTHTHTHTRRTLQRYLRKRIFFLVRKNGDVIVGRSLFEYVRGRLSKRKIGECARRNRNRSGTNDVELGAATRELGLGYLRCSIRLNAHHTIYHLRIKNQ